VKRAVLALLVACSKKPAPPPAPVVIIDAAPPPPPVASSVAPAPVTCEPAETRTPPLFVVKGWIAAYAKAAGFEEEKAGSEAEAKSTLCRMDACAEAPPWIVKPRMTLHTDPTNLVTPVSGGRLAVLRVGVTGTDFCDGPAEAVNRLVLDQSVKDDVIVYDEETTPLRRADDGCEQAAPPTHRWHAVDTRTKKEWVFRGDVHVEVDARAIVAKKAGCAEIRYSR
jgi:hypothetical protein